jgi:hypothetical protein
MSDQAVAEKVDAADATARHWAKIGEILTSDAWTAGEKFIVKWQFRLLGDFKTALVGAIMLADEQNLARLHLGFPGEVDGFLAWSVGDLGRRLRDAGLDI